MEKLNENANSLDAQAVNRHVTATNAVLKRIYEKVIQGLIDDGNYHEVTITALDVKMIEMYMARKEDQGDKLDARVANSYWVWVTINPPSEVTYPQLKKTVEDIIKWKWHKEHFYVYEQRGDTPETQGNGIHCHMLLDRVGGDKVYTPCEVKRQLLRKISPWKYDIKFSKLVEGDKLIKYMLGNKKEDKLDKCQIDKDFRESLGISPYYTNMQKYLNFSDFLLKDGVQEEDVSEEVSEESSSEEEVCEAHLPEEK